MGKTVRFTVRFQPLEAETIRLMADASLMSVAAFLRSRALAEDLHIRRLKALQGELRKLGGLQKHLVMQGGWSAADREQFSAVMHELFKTATFVRETLDAR